MRWAHDPCTTARTWRKTNGLVLSSSSAPRGLGYGKVSKEPRHLKAIREAVLPRLPELPGVYFMKDKHDAVIYIGKAKRLRSRVRSYFTGIEAHPERTRKLVRAVRTVEWTETGSELAALLLESRLIKEHQPRFNRAQRRYQKI